MIDLKKEVREAQQAHEIIDSESYRNAYQRLEAFYIEQLLKIPLKPNRDDSRARAQMKIECLRDFKKQFETVIRDGKVAESKIAEIDKEKARSFLW